MSRDKQLVEFDVLKGLVITHVEVSSDGDKITFTADLDRRRFEMYHDQDCCESVSLEDVVGDWNDLLYSPILLAEESTSDDAPKYEGDESFTWTFYKLATAKGYIDLRWYGTSNGYYSEAVSFYEVSYG